MPNLDKIFASLESQMSDLRMQLEDEGLLGGEAEDMEDEDMMEDMEAETSAEDAMPGEEDDEWA